jgi:hypothetical protein
MVMAEKRFRMLRYTGRKPLRLQGEDGKLRLYCSPGGKIAIGKHNAGIEAELLARGDFEAEPTVGAEAPPTEVAAEAAPEEVPPC